MRPFAKRNGLSAEQFDDELIVYDQNRNRGHCLNRTAALVWRHADGQRTIADLVEVLRAELDPVADDHLVWHTLDCLNAAHLLESPQPRSVDDMRAARRQFISKIGLIGVATLLLPVVSSVVAPSAAQGQPPSCGSSGGFSALVEEWLTRES